MNDAATGSARDAPVESAKALILRLPVVKTIIDLLQNHGQLEYPENFVVPDVRMSRPVRSAYLSRN